ncbi:MAG TPA: VIT domain-containing protein [Candidatus Polarisedimenticolia bacterium]|jgi:Ca-activated chloride channel family protein|nr:VIT domain-containing protein [Candidatus Polarisedimenticolia bacterium]
MRRIPVLAHAVVLLALFLIAAPGALRAQQGPATQPGESTPANPIPGGELRATSEKGETKPFPLKHTDVHAEITGNVAQVRVNQVFQNPYDHPIEAVYVFPLPHKAAVDDMEIRIGDRVIRGAIKKREEARALYDVARRSGRTAALLDQERPNIFTQSVANILPGEEIVVSIRFFDVLTYDSGFYEFVFPMVVGERFMPGNTGPRTSAPWGQESGNICTDVLTLADVAGASGDSETEIAPEATDELDAEDDSDPDNDLDTDDDGTDDPADVLRGATAPGASAPDTARITPPVLGPGERSGHDIALEVQLQTGLRLHDLASTSHAVDIDNPAPGRATVRLRQEDSIPNKDFVLRFRLDGSAPEVTVLPHRATAGDPGYFLMFIQPELQPAHARITPKEMIFVVDCSGSMSGEPIEKVKEAMRYALENLNPLDNFQIIRFADNVEVFAPDPVPATPSHVARALEYVDELSGNGGTILLDGVEASLSYPEDPQRLRIVSFMTDGFIGNEDEILAYLREHLGGARLFSFGVGSSPNRYLLDKMAEFGRGGVEYLPLNENAGESVRSFYDKIRNPYLTDLEVNWGDFKVSDAYPAQLPDLFLGKPIVLMGRYDQAGAGDITLHGKLGGQPYERRLTIQLPERSDGGEAIASLWARSKIEELSNQLIGNPNHELVEEITDVALSHRLVSAYTSFVAVEEQPRTEPVEPEQVKVPLVMPEGMKEEPVASTDSAVAGGVAGSVVGGVEGGVVGGVIGGVLGGVPGGVPGQGYAETVTVAAQSEVISTSSASVATTASAAYISNLPVMARDYQDVLTLAPGVTEIENSGSPNIHGALDTEVVTLVDGADTTDPFSGQSSSNISAKALAEIQVITSGATAQFSRATGGFVKIAKGRKGIPGAKQAVRHGPFPTLCRLAAPQKSYHVGENIALYVAIKNISPKTVKIPASLSVFDGTALFRILDDEWNAITPQPAYVKGPAKVISGKEVGSAQPANPGKNMNPARMTSSSKKRDLQPGEWIVFKILLNGKGGYHLDRPGLYHLVLLGSHLGFPDTIQLTLRIDE